MDMSKRMNEKVVNDQSVNMSNTFHHEDDEYDDLNVSNVSGNRSKRKRTPSRAANQSAMDVSIDNEYLNQVDQI